MKRKLIKLTESDLHNIIMRTVRKSLNEDFEPNYSTNPEDQPDFEPEKEKTVLKLMKIRQVLAEIMDSDFIPFASPAPSSTEQIVKESIIKADQLIENAIEKCNELGYGF